MLGLGLMMRFSNFEVSLPIPTFITDYIPFVKSEAGPDKINILLTGVGGGGHEGPELTDTVILASVQYRTNSVTLLSLPRQESSFAEIAGIPR